MSISLRVPCLLALALLLAVPPATAARRDAGVAADAGFTLDRDGRLAAASGALSVAVGRDGAIVTAAAGTVREVRATLELAFLERDGRRFSVPATIPAGDGDGVVIERGLARERLGTDRGRVQFAIEILAPPGDERGRWTLGIAVTGLGGRTLSASGRDALLFDPRTENGLRFSVLRVLDAAGRTLAFDLALDDDGVRVGFDDGGASYPLSVESELAATEWTAYGAQADAFFGVSVAGAGDVNRDGYDDVVVGAYQHDETKLDEGQAAVYLGSASGLAATPVWSQAGGQAGAFFGRRVAAAGDVNKDGFGDILVSATSWDGSFFNEGRVQLFLGSPSGPQAAAAWSREGKQADAAYGIALAGAGDVNHDGYADVVIGTANWDAAGRADCGKAELFLGSAAGLQLTPAWTYTGTQAGELLGLSVAIAGDVNGDGYDDVAVGAAGYSNGQSGEGRVLLFNGRASGLSATPSFIAEGNQAGAALGQSVARAGSVNGDGYDDLIAGARLYDATQPDEGRALVYAGSASGLIATPLWIADGGQAEGSFGIAVSGIGDVNDDGFDDVMVGAFLFDGQNADEGKAVVFLGSASGPRSTPAFSTFGGAADARLGFSLGPAGDVNGDGRRDTIVGAHFYTNTLSREGRATVFFGPLIAPPPQVGGTLRATREGATVRLEWQPPDPLAGSGPVTYYRIHRDVSPAGTFPAIAGTESLLYRDTGAAGATPPFYGYLVTAENSGPMP